MKHIIAFLTILLTITSCHTSKMSKREVIDPGATTGLVFLSDKTTLRIHNQLSETNPINALNKNITYCKAHIAATLFNAIEDCCMYYINNYTEERSEIEIISNVIIKEMIDDAVVVYNKTTTSDNHTYTSIITLELKKDKLLKELETTFIEEKIVDATNAETLRKAIDKRLTPKY